MIDYPPRPVVVLGAGLTGAVVALELARAGKRVAIIDRDPVAMNRASLRNEGKIHLGLVYAAEQSLSTARLMLEGALSFRRLVAGALKGRSDALIVSTRFSYLVANDSIVTPWELNERYEATPPAWLTLSGVRSMRSRIFACSPATRFALSNARLAGFGLRERVRRAPGDTMRNRLSTVSGRTA
jgi:glycine/D-amino acid oxidase-like deaminating enzyme